MKKINIDDLIKDLRTEVEQRIGAAPGFEFPEVGAINPGGTVKAVVECSRALEYCGDLRGDLPTIFYKLAEIENAARQGDYSVEVMESARNYFKQAGRALDIKYEQLKMHLTTLRSLLTNLTKYPNLIVFEEDDEDFLPDE